MSELPRPPDKEQELLRHARREGLVVMLLWAITLLWSVTYSYVFGYDLPADKIRLIWGIPDWVVWSIILPWILCLLFSAWYCFLYMADDDLGHDPDEGVDHA